MDLEDEGRFKMNPPLRDIADKEALLEGIKDGTIDMIATDHAPHSIEEKSRGLLGSPFGIVGLETAFPVLYTKLVLGRIISLEKLISLMSTAPGKRFELAGGIIENGAPADITVIDLNREFRINPEDFASMGKATPFQGWLVKGSVDMTLVDGEVKWERNMI
jgi:dihydroorotase